MQHRYFYQDKNHILRQAQHESQDEFLYAAVKLTLKNFLLIENPMGLKDDFIVSLTTKKFFNLEFLTEFYEVASAIYRYKFGNPQLEILWDGSSHFEHYRSEWQSTFLNWVKELSQNKSFTRIIIKACILFSDEQHPMLKYQLNRILLSEFRLKLSKKKELIAA